MTINYSSNGKETELGLLTANSSKKVAITKEAEQFIDSCAENSLIAIHNHPSKGSFSVVIFLLIIIRLSLKRLL